MGIVAIRYYNVWFYLHLQSELDVAKFLYLSKRIDAGVDCQVKLTHFFVESCPTLAADKVGVLRWVNSICQS